ncbi:MAG TPA: hypothetical protein VMB34_29455 [Acetobacteraceae bacterium]|nr:hypothetical protein [Acetobacteraceae bacterium]
MTFWRAGRIDRWLTIMALSLEGLGWPTAAELWLAELSRPPANDPPLPDPPTQSAAGPTTQGDPTP